jgi:hypothetical protein
MRPSMTRGNKSSVRFGSGIEVFIELGRLQSLQQGSPCAIAWLLMQHVINYARAEGIGIIEGQVLSGNMTMLAMCKQLGFATEPDPNDERPLRITPASIASQGGPPFEWRRPVRRGVSYFAQTPRGKRRSLVTAD